jgi:hypothetical protein
LAVNPFAIRDSAGDRKTRWRVRSPSMCTARCGLFGDTGRELGPTQSGVGVMLAGDAALRVWRSSGAGLGVTAISISTRLAPLPDSGSS